MIGEAIKALPEELLALQPTVPAPLDQLTTAVVQLLTVDQPSADDGMPTS